MKPLLIVDGYNVIGAEKNMALASDLETLRDHLRTDLENYAGYTNNEIILVFDGYQSGNPLRTEEKYGDLTVVYTKHGETADSYIERKSAGIPKYREVYVATSDSLEQSQIFATGAIRITSAELIRLLNDTREKGIRDHIRVSGIPHSQSIGKKIPETVQKALEEIRLSKD